MHQMLRTQIHKTKAPGLKGQRDTDVITAGTSVPYSPNQAG